VAFRLISTMNSLRLSRTTSVAACLAAALFACIVMLPARAAESFRLDRIGIVRFTHGDEGMLRRHSGILHQDGRISWRTMGEVPRPANTPDWALGRTLISNVAWLTYRALGTTALDNFELTDGTVRFSIGEESYHFVAPNPFGYIASGRMVNLSTRARLAAGDDVIAGFVIDERPRVVLVRAVGPGLAQFGVAEPASDPLLSVRHNGQTLQFNDNWWTQPDAPQVRQAAVMVGAFPLEENSRDAASLLLLPPGVYTVHVETVSPDVPGGQVLVEVYSVPDEAIVVDASTQEPADGGMTGIGT
jgi:hypothetical protein